MYADEAVRLNVGPVIPGAAANAVAVRSIAIASTGARDLAFKMIFFMFVALIAALLIDPNFGHKSAEVLGVVRQVIKIGGVQVEHAAGGIFGGVTGVQNYVE